MGIFYKISHPNGKISYLYGTMHANNIKLPIEAQTAFNNATACAFEVDVLSSQEDPIILYEEWLTHQFNSGMATPEAYERHLADAKIKVRELYEQYGNSITEEELTSKFEKNRTPITWAQLITSPPDLKEYTQNPLDKQLMHAAVAQEKQVVYLESVEEQYNYGLGLFLNYAEQLEYYQHKAAQLAPNINLSYEPETAEKLLSLMQEKYYAGNLEKPALATSAAVARYDQVIIGERDQIMTERMQELIFTGNAFIAVGAHHLPGITQLLANDYECTIESLAITVPTDRDYKTTQKENLNLYSNVVENKFDYEKDFPWEEKLPINQYAFFNPNNINNNLSQLNTIFTEKDPTTLLNNDINDNIEDTAAENNSCCCIS